MGVDIEAFSKVKPVKCTDSDECWEKCIHLPVGDNADGLKPGCYVRRPGGKKAFLHFSYGGICAFMDELSILAFGVPRDEAGKHLRGYQGKPPFIELLFFAGMEGASIGPRTSAKLHADFVAFATRAKKHFVAKKVSVPPPVSKRRKKVAVDEAEDNVTWMWQAYRDFRKIFKVASDKGVVSFF